MRDEMHVSMAECVQRCHQLFQNRYCTQLMIWLCCQSTASQ